MASIILRQWNLSTLTSRIPRILPRMHIHRTITTIPTILTHIRIIMDQPNHMLMRTLRNPFFKTLHMPKTPMTSKTTPHMVFPQMVPYSPWTERQATLLTKLIKKHQSKEDQVMPTLNKMKENLTTWTEIQSEDPVMPTLIKITTKLNIWAETTKIQSEDQVMPTLNKTKESLNIWTEMTRIQREDLP